ncbi:hypothetical protein [Blastococcus sp. TML/C7B]|uniref:hypothetical protein n=1 Tax=Blastococcus sp. TML/C7B TaxID=2798728 RepID=UPI002714E937|nr:hypothetical protein [Blastococcus sp. TML/C7B]
MTASIPPTAHSSSGTSCRGMASSMTSRIRNGVPSATTEEATISATTTASWAR